MQSYNAEKSWVCCTSLRFVKEYSVLPVLGSWSMLLNTLWLLAALADGAAAATVSVRTTGLVKAYRSRLLDA